MWPQEASKSSRQMSIRRATFADPHRQPDRRRWPIDRGNPKESRRPTELARPPAGGATTDRIISFSADRRQHRTYDVLQHVHRSPRRFRLPVLPSDARPSADGPVRDGPQVGSRPPAETRRLRSGESRASDEDEAGPAVRRAAGGRWPGGVWWRHGRLPRHRQGDAVSVHGKTVGLGFVLRLLN